MKHHDQRQLREKEFIWACSFSGRIHHGRRGLTEHGQSRKLKNQLFNYVGKSGRATRKLSDAIYAQSLSQGCSFFSKAPHPKSSIVFPQRLPTTENQTFKYVSLCGASHSNRNRADSLLYLGEMRAPTLESNGCALW